MRRMLPPLPWLRAFEASARHLSFTLAASELGLTPAAVSKHVKNLEFRLGQTLFVRHARSLSLTRVGEAYLPKVRDAFDRLAAGTSEVFGSKRVHNLTVRCAAGFALNWLLPRLKQFREQNPKINFHLLSSIWNEPAEPGTYHLDIRYGTGDWADHSSFRLTHDRIFPVCTPAIAQRLNKPGDLAAHTLIHVLGYQDGWGNWLAEAGHEELNGGGGLFFDNSLAAFRAATLEMGVAMGRTSIAAYPVAKGELVRPFELELPVEEAFHALIPLGQEEHPDTQALVDWLRQQADQTGSAVI